MGLCKTDASHTAPLSTYSWQDAVIQDGSCFSSRGVFLWFYSKGAGGLGVLRRAGRVGGGGGEQ